MEQTISSDREKCLYFREYMRVKGLLAGDKFKGHEYINWITDKHSEYRKQIGIDRYKPYSIEEEKQFENYLIGVERGGVGGSSDN